MTMTTDRFEARVERAHQLLAEAAALLLRHGEAGAGSTDPTSTGAATSDEGGRSPLQASIEAFETALVLAPRLRPVAWEYGVALLYQGRLREAAGQFECCAALDRDDAEPWLWRFLCIARLEGLKAARASLEAWKGYDTRLCMMAVVELFKGHATLEEVLDGACGDRHSTARATFAAALYYEARGEGELSLPLLKAVAELDGDAGDEFLRALARCHLRVLEARLATQWEWEGRPAAAVTAGGKGPAAAASKRLEEDREEKGARSFLAFAAGAWGRTPSLDSSDGSTASSSSLGSASLSSSLSSSRSWCCSGGCSDEGRLCSLADDDAPFPFPVQRARSYWQ